MDNKIKKIWCVAMLLLTHSAFSLTEYGYFFKNEKPHSVIKFKTDNNLIIIPAKINNKELSLILDTGVQDIILFGKKFNSFKNTPLEVAISGWGRKKSYTGSVSVHNYIDLGDIEGKGISLIVTEPPQFQPLIKGVDGIIGYQIFSRFVVKIDYKVNELTIYRNGYNPKTGGFLEIPLIIEDKKPYVNVRLTLTDNNTIPLKLLVDTGASLSIMMNYSEIGEFYVKRKRKVIGYGMGGKITGRIIACKEFAMGPYRNNLSSVSVTFDTGNYKKKFNSDGILGNSILKNSISIFDYSQGKMFISGG